MSAHAPLSLIAAMDRNRLIGVNGQLPWRLPQDLKHFKALTLGQTVLMGRKTWDSLGRPLPQRDNWVLTRDRGFAPDGCRVFHRLEDALTTPTQGRLMVIGGAELYRLTLPQAHRLYLTLVDAELQGDTWFPDYAAQPWRETARVAHAADERHAHPYCFLTLDRA